MRKIIFTLALASGVFTAYLVGSTRIVSTNQFTQNDLAYDSVPKKDTAKKASAKLAFVRFNMNDSLPKKDTAKKASAKLAFVRFNMNDSLPKKDTASKKESMDLLARN
jgi:hypothetical protein